MISDPQIQGTHGLAPPDQGDPWSETPRSRKSMTSDLQIKGSHDPGPKIRELHDLRPQGQGNQSMTCDLQVKKSPQRTLSLLSHKVAYVV